MDVAEVVAEYLASISVQKNSKAVYRQRLLVFADWCKANNIGFEDLGSKRSGAIANDFIAYLESDHHASKQTSAGKPRAISSHTVQGYMVVIKMMLNWAVEDEEMAVYIHPIALKRMHIPKADHSIVEIFSGADIDAMMVACRQEYNDHLRLRNGAIVSLLSHTGIRAAELCTLSVGHVVNLTLLDMTTETSYIKVMGKGHKEREIDIDNSCRKLLAHYKRSFRKGAPPDAPFFVDRTLRKPLSVSGVEQIIEKLGQIAGITDVRCSPHTFRHTFATHFIRDGGDILHLSRILGHEHLSITEDYIETLSSRDLRGGLRRVK